MPPCIIDRPKGTGDWLLMFFHEPVLLEWNRERQWTANSQLMIWSPDQSHYYGNPHRRWNHSWAHVNGSMPRNLLPRLKIPINEPISLSEPHFFEKHILMINEEIREHHSVSGQIVVNLFENLLISIQRDITTFSRSSPIPEKFLKLKHELETQFAQPVRLKQLAARVGLSVPHFCFEFKRHFGVSAIDYVIQLRLHQASFLLKNRNRTVADIAAEVGYEDLYYFSKLYKKYYGYSPRSIRKL